MTKVINVFGAPGVGKSTYAALLFSKMKEAGFNCELVQEYARELIYSEDRDLLDDQLLVLGQQYGKVLKVAGWVDYIITDSPLILSQIYNARCRHPYDVQQFEGICTQAFNKFDNLNILLTHKPRPYEKHGRREGLEQSLEIESEIIKTMRKNNFSCAVNPSVEKVVDYLNFCKKLSNYKAEKQHKEGMERVKKLLEMSKKIKKNENGEMVFMD